MCMYVYVSIYSPNTSLLSYRITTNLNIDL